MLRSLGDSPFYLSPRADISAVLFHKLAILQLFMIPPTRFKTLSCVKRSIILKKQLIAYIPTTCCIYDCLIFYIKRNLTNFCWYEVGLFSIFLVEWVQFSSIIRISLEILRAEGAIALCHHRNQCESAIFLHDSKAPMVESILVNSQIEKVNLFILLAFHLV